MHTIFSDEEKCEVFDALAQRFFHQNFSLASKSEIELLLFHYFLKRKKRDSLLPDGSIDYHAFSDYAISKELGISQMRVRNLKVKDQLAFPQELHVEEEFARLLRHARYDRSTGKIMVSIPDPNLFLEIQNLIEEKGGFIERQLNSKLLIMRAEYFLELVTQLEPPETQKKIRSTIRSAAKQEDKDTASLSGESIGRMLLGLGVDLTSLAADLSSLISPQNVLAATLLRLLSA